MIASCIEVEVASKQQVLEILELTQRCDLVLSQVLETGQLEKQISKSVQDQVENSRRDFLLRQQLEAIKKSWEKLKQRETRVYLNWKLDLEI
jgi:ATP-dependent Lon protease